MGKKDETNGSDADKRDEEEGGTLDDLARRVQEQRQRDRSDGE